MPHHIKNRIASFAASVVEKSLLGYFSGIRKTIIGFIDSVPENITKLYYISALFVFLVVLSVSGIAVATFGAVLIIISLSDNSVDKILLSGILLTVAGFLYCIVTLFILKIVGGVIHSSLNKSADRVIRKISK